MVVGLVILFAVTLYLQAKNREAARIGTEESNRVWLTEEVRKILEEGK